MTSRKLIKLLVLCAVAGTALVTASSAFAWTVTLTAEPKLKRTYSWKIEKSVSKPAVTVKAGETAVVTYSVTATPLGFVESDYRVDGTAKLSRDPNITVNDVDVDIQLQDIIFDRDAIPAAVACDQLFPVVLSVNEVNCTYGVALPDTTPRNVVMRATLVGGGRVVQQEFDFTNATVDQVDESVAVTDSMGGALGTVNAADGPKTFTYTKTIGPYTAAQCGAKTINNTATYTTVDSGATGSASAAVAVTVTCPPPPPPKCEDDKGHGGYGDHKSKDKDKGKGGKGGHDDCDEDDDDCRGDKKYGKGCDHDDDNDCRDKDHKSGKSGKSGHGGDKDCDGRDHDRDHDRDCDHGRNDDHDRGDHDKKKGKKNGH